jgi:hypothetical protein
VGGQNFVFGPSPATVSRFTNSNRHSTTTTVSIQNLKRQMINSGIQIPIASVASYSDSIALLGHMVEKCH